MNMICSLCNNKIKKWSHIGKRQNVRCPYCNSAERHRLTALFLQIYNITYNNFLHIAPEFQLQTLFKKRSNNYICGDLEPKKYYKLNAIYLDATNMSFKNDSFDCIYASHILEHIIEDKKAMSEMYRVLKKNGTLITMVPQNFSLQITDEDYFINTPEERLLKYGQTDHVRIYGLDFSKRLQECGFYVTIYYIKSQEEYVEKMKYDDKKLLRIDNENIYNLNREDLLYICHK